MLLLTKVKTIFPSNFKQVSQESHILEFKVVHCNKASCHDYVTCYMHHDFLDRRRPLFLTEYGKLNYDNKLCSYAEEAILAERVNEAESTPLGRASKNAEDALCKYYNCGYSGGCPEGDSCTLAHNNYEALHHPFTYKLKACSHRYINNVCAALGSFCYKYHSSEKPRYKAFPEELIEKSEEKWDLFVARNESLYDGKNEDTFSADTFKVRRCHKKGPHTTSLCPYFHDFHDRRREAALYLSSWCPSVLSSSDPLQCPEGDECMYAHTRYELMFHQNNYKTEQCKNYMERGFCPRGVYCAFKHASYLYGNKEKVGGHTEDLKAETSEIESQIKILKAENALLESNIIKLSHQLAICEEISECPVCLSVKVGSICRALPCGHTLCDSCFNKIFKIQWQFSLCPVCKISFSLSAARKIYL